MPGIPTGDLFGKWLESVARVSVDAGPEISQIARRDPQTAKALYKLQYAFESLQRAFRTANVTTLDHLFVLGTDGAPVAWIGARPPYFGGWFKEFRVGGTGPNNSPLVADSNGNLSINGSVLVSGSVSAAAFNVLQVFITGITLTSNSPAAGRIAWSACTLYYNGATYSISSGNTPSSSERFVYWDVGNTTFTAAASFTPQANRFLIATNNTGTADHAWNKLPSRGIQEANLVPGLLTGGYSVQDISVAINIQLNSVAETTIINESAQGVLLSVSARVTTPITATQATAGFKITVDGASEQYLQVFSASQVFLGRWIGNSSNNQGDGSTAGDFLGLQLGITYKTSLVVKFVVTAAAGNGVCDASAWRALKVS